MRYSIILLIVLPAITFGMLIDTRPKDEYFVNDTGETLSTTSSTVTPLSDDEYRDSNHLSASVTSHDAQESANFFTDIGPPSFSARTFDPPEYDSLFDTFPNLPYFPDFGEIFRIQRSTTPKPPFRFPDYVRDPFSEPPPETPLKNSRRPGDTGTSITGGRRPSRRPPRPASSGTKTKLVKQNQSEPKEKVKTGKTKLAAKARDYPKIFRFTADRVNLADFDMRKKMNGNYETLAKGDDLDSSKIQRNNFLILHGGVFEIERSVNNGLFVASSNVMPVTETPDSDTSFGSRLEKSGKESYYET